MNDHAIRDFHQLSFGAGGAMTLVIHKFIQVRIHINITIWIIRYVYPYCVIGI